METRMTNEQGFEAVYMIDPVYALLEEVIAGLERRLAFETYCAARTCDSSDASSGPVEPSQPAP